MKTVSIILSLLISSFAWAEATNTNSFNDDTLGLEGADMPISVQASPNLSNQIKLSFSNCEFESDTSHFTISSSKDLPWGRTLDIRSIRLKYGAPIICYPKDEVLQATPYPEVLNESTQLIIKSGFKYSPSSRGTNRRIYVIYLKDPIPSEYSTNRRNQEIGKRRRQVSLLVKKGVQINSRPPTFGECLDYIKHFVAFETKSLSADVSPFILPAYDYDTSHKIGIDINGQKYKVEASHETCDFMDSSPHLKGMQVHK